MAKTIVIDGVYTLKKKLGEAGMASVFLAEVDLEEFDYSTLYAYTQVDGESHTERRNRAEVFGQEDLWRLCSKKEPEQPHLATGGCPRSVENLWHRGD